MSSEKWQSFFLGLNVLTHGLRDVAEIFEKYDTE